MKKIFCLLPLLCFFMSTSSLANTCSNVKVGAPQKWDVTVAYTPCGGAKHTKRLHKNTGNHTFHVEKGTKITFIGFDNEDYEKCENFFGACADRTKKWDILVAKNVGISCGGISHHVAYCRPCSGTEPNC